MRIMHAYCLNYNFGDYALGYGVKNIFRKIFNNSFFIGDLGWNWIGSFSGFIKKVQIGLALYFFNSILTLFKDFAWWPC